MPEAGFAPKAQQLFSTSLLLEQTSRSFSVYLDSHSQSVLALNIKFSEIPSRTWKTRSCSWPSRSGWLSSSSSWSPSSRSSSGLALQAEDSLLQTFRWKLISLFKGFQVFLSMPNGHYPSEKLTLIHQRCIKLHGRRCILLIMYFQFQFTMFFPTEQKMQRRTSLYWQCKATR